jgi:hypothetical protein
MVMLLHACRFAQHDSIKKDPRPREVLTGRQERARPRAKHSTMSHVSAPRVVTGGVRHSEEPHRGRHEHPGLLVPAVPFREDVTELSVHAHARCRCVTAFNPQAGLLALDPDSPVGLPTPPGKAGEVASIDWNTSITAARPRRILTDFPTPTLVPDESSGLRSRLRAGLP